MGHREDLLAGAKRCLYEKGYARTTARDIVAASGTNLASIGYHYGTTEALLNAAMIEAIEDWSAEVERALTAEVEPSAMPLERFAAIWGQMIGSFGAQRQLWIATVEALVQAEHAPQVRAFLGDALQQGREGLATLFQPSDTPPNEKTVRTVGSLYQALMTGVLVQWLVDPERAPSGDDLAEALRLIAGSLQAPRGMNDE